MSGELSHEALAESSDLRVRSALGVEVGSTLSSSHHETGKSVLEDLLETQAEGKKRKEGSEMSYFFGQRRAIGKGSLTT